MTQLTKDPFGLGAGFGHRIGPQSAGDDCELAVIFVLIAPRHVGADVAQIACEKALRLGHMHPGKRSWVGRLIGCPIGQGTTDLSVDTVDPANRRHRVITVRKGCDGNKARRALQPPVHVLAEIRMIEHALQRVGVEHLKQQRAHPAGHHPDDIGMHQPDRRVAFEQRLIRGRSRRLAFRGIMKHAAHLRDELQTQRFDRIGHGENIGALRKRERRARQNARPGAQTTACRHGPCRLTVRPQ